MSFILRRHVVFYTVDTQGALTVDLNKPLFDGSSASNLDEGLHGVLTNFITVRGPLWKTLRPGKFASRVRKMIFEKRSLRILEFPQNQFFGGKKI